MLIMRTTIPRSGASAHVGMVTFGEAGKRAFKVVGDPCALPPL